MNKKIIIIVVVVVVLAIILGILVMNNKKTGTTSTSTEKNNKSNVANTEKQNENNNIANAKYSSGLHHATMVVKDYGTINLELDADIAPITVANFAKLVESGYYNGLTFHRIMEGFMAQGGQSTKPAENIEGEFIANGVKNTISHTRGTISMARANYYNSASSQFFIVHKDSLFLDGNYAGFGHVTSGIEVIDKICEEAKPTDSNGTIKKEEQPIIESIVMVD